MIAAGEAGGILDTILLRLATFMEKNDALVRKVKGAMVYPLVIMSVAVIAITILLIFVIPTFSAMFASVNVELPLPTRIVIAMSHFLTSFWWAILGVIAGAWFMVKRYYATSGGRKNIDTLLINSPVLGDVIRKSAVSRFTRTLGTLVSSGVAILDGLEITAKTAGNRVIHDAVMESRASIAGGDTIAGPLERSKVFPPMVVSMIAVGEQTGGLDEMLSKIADFYDEEVDVAVSALPVAHGAGDDRDPRRGGRWHGHRHVPADLRHDERGAVGKLASKSLLRIAIGEGRLAPALSVVTARS
jgi:type IV pilus assembly protein PilC